MYQKLVFIIQNFAVHHQNFSCLSQNWQNFGIIRSKFAKMLVIKVNILVIRSNLSVFGYTKSCLLISIHLHMVDI